MKKSVIILFISLVQIQVNLGQTIPVGTPMIEDYLRREQLLGNFDPNFSFNYRPIHTSKVFLKSDSTLFNSEKYFKSINKSLKLLPAELRVSYDLRHPDSRNDGPMIRSKGMQTLLSAGIFYEKGFLSVQLKPEFVYAQNKYYEGFPTYPKHYESTWRIRYVWYNWVDLPERYGTDSYNRFFWGQSSIRFNKWGMSLGISTENIWWGPAIRNSLLMSNNAAGFPHITFNSLKPLKTKIGHLEWQFITARLEESGFNPPADNIPFEGRILYTPKNDDWRYLQGISISYSPKWIKGLSLGFSRWVQQYHELARETKDYFPALSNLFRQNDNNVTRSEWDRDQAAGLFGRWIWLDSNAEVYFEFAKNDAALNLRDLLVDTDHSRALTFGFNKLFVTQNPQAFFKLNFEWNQTSQTESGLIRNAWSWYIHSRVRQGYTHNGEVLGSSLGPGGNAQFLEVSWVKNLNRIGGAIERRIHNNDFAVAAFPDDFTRYWVDYSIYGFLDWHFDKLILSTTLYFTNSLNYQWRVRFDPNDPKRFPDTPGVDRTNWNLDIKLAYTF